jgi:hypothetical protein
VVASFFQTATLTETEVHDLTNGQYWVGTYGANSGETTYGIGVEGDTPAIPFTTTTMSLDQLNGDYLGFENPIQVDLVNNTFNGHILIKAGALSNNGTSFKLMFNRKT